MGQLLGRESESAALAGAVQSARDGTSAVLVLTGEGGVGKTRLLEQVLVGAADCSVVRIDGLETEMGLGFAGLHRLLLPLLGGLADLPHPQRSALRVIFGIDDGPGADPFLVGLATLTLLSNAASERPVVCVVDDAQWVDRETVAVLAFVSRRLLADRVAVLFACRDGELDPLPLAGLPALLVSGLEEDTALELLRSAGCDGLDDELTNRIVRETAGNPLALVELAREISERHISRRPDPLEPLPLSRRLEAHFARAATDLPDATRMCMMLAAAEPTGDRRFILGGAAALGIDADALLPAEHARLVVVSDRIVFRHPLIRSAIYGAASPADRRRAHAALAAVATDDASVDLRAWHRGCAVAGPDETVAAELEQSAERARRRGGYSVEASFLARAADLTLLPDRRVDRLLASSRAAAAAGAQQRARALLETATDEAADAGRQAFCAWLDGLFLMHEGRYGESPRELFASAQSLRDTDPGQARIVMLDALGSTCLAGDRSVGPPLIEVAEAALRLPRGPGDHESMADLLLDGLAGMVASGFTAAVPTMRRAVRSWAPDQLPAENVTLWCLLGTYAATEMLDDEALARWVESIEAYSRRNGAVALLRVVLYGLATSAEMQGRFADAAVINAEAHELNLATGAPAHLKPLIDVELLALRGVEAETRSAVLVNEALADASGFDAAACRGLLAISRLELGLGNYRAAFDAASALSGRATLGPGAIALVDLVEAAVRCGETAAAEHAAEVLASRVVASDTPWGLGLLARCQALLAPDDRAEQYHRESVRVLGETAMRFDLARSQLVYGEWLRRQNRRRDARSQLRTAFDAFESMGADGFAQRALIELRATGEHARRRTADTSALLTPQERQIAELAADRATNPEIAAKLFISAATVDYHLRKVFRKLGISSRRQLAVSLRVERAGVPRVVVDERPSAPTGGEAPSSGDESANEVE